MFFVDEFDRQLDDRGRFILPAKLAEKLSAVVYITRSPSEKCLHLYSSEGWDIISRKLAELPQSVDRAAAAFVRIFSGSASECEIDKQRRVSISSRLIEFAGLNKDIVLVGANTRMEIWDKKEWESYCSALDGAAISDGIAKYGLNI